MQFRTLSGSMVFVGACDQKPHVRMFAAKLFSDEPEWPAGRNNPDAVAHTSATAVVAAETWSASHTSPHQGCHWKGQFAEIFIIPRFCKVPKQLWFTCK